MTTGVLFRRSDWEKLAENYRHYFEVQRWDAERYGGTVDAIYEEPHFRRLCLDLGGPAFFALDGMPFGRFPYHGTMGMGMEMREFCTRVPFNLTERVEWSCQVEEDDRLRLWPWIAQFAVRYADKIGNYDPCADLTPSETDELLGQIALNAQRLSENLRRLHKANYMDRPYSPYHWRKSFTLAAVTNKLSKLIGWPYTALEKEAAKLAELSSVATSLRGEIADWDFTLPKGSQNAGVVELTVACAYLWAGVTERAPSAARTHSKYREGPESDFVRFVQSIAGLLTNDLPTINQVHAALAIDWSDFTDVFTSGGWRREMAQDNDDSAEDGAR